MKLCIVILAILVSGCKTIPVIPVIPALPVELSNPCAELTTINQSTTTLSNLLKVVTENYGKYHECAASKEAIIEWYNKNRDLINSISKIN